MENIIKLETIQDYNNLLGTKTLHPLVSVTDLSTLKSIRHCRKNFGFIVCSTKNLLAEHFSMAVINTIMKTVHWFLSLRGK